MKKLSAANIDARLRAACAGRAPEASLLELAREFKERGMAQGEMYRHFDEARARHEDEEDETALNAILDVMDVIWGWCSPSRRLFPECLEGSPTGSNAKNNVWRCKDEQ